MTVHRTAQTHGPGASPALANPPIGETIGAGLAASIARRGWRGIVDPRGLRPGLGGDVSAVVDAGLAAAPGAATARIAPLAGALALPLAATLVRVVNVGLLCTIQQITNAAAPAVQRCTVGGGPVR